MTPALIRQPPADPQLTHVLAVLILDATENLGLFVTQHHYGNKRTDTTSTNMFLTIVEDGNAFKGSSFLFPLYPLPWDRAQNDTEDQYFSPYFFGQRLSVQNKNKTLHIEPDVRSALVGGMQGGALLWEGSRNQDDKIHQPRPSSHVMISTQSLGTMALWLFLPRGSQAYSQACFHITITQDL